MYCFKRGLAEKINAGSTLSHLRYHQYFNRCCHRTSASRHLMERSDQAESEKGHLFSLYHTHTVRPAPRLKCADSKHKGSRRVCIATALELASLRDYFDNADKPCASKPLPYILITITNNKANQGSTLILPSGDSMIPFFLKTC